MICVWVREVSLRRGEDRGSKGKPTRELAHHDPKCIQPRQADLRGGHVIKLGPNNDDAAREAVQVRSGP